MWSGKLQEQFGKTAVRSDPSHRFTLPVVKEHEKAGFPVLSRLKTRCRVICEGEGNVW